MSMIQSNVVIVGVLCALLFTYLEVIYIPAEKLTGLLKSPEW